MAESVKSRRETGAARADLRRPVATALLCGAVMLAYLNSFGGPLVFDDLGAIRANPSIRDLYNLAAVLSPPNDSGTTVNGRPLLNLTLALNYAMHGERVAGYHAVNLAIHLAATLTLLGLGRRLFARAPGIQPRSAEFAALCTAGIWALHPLQTQSVTYIIQRAEALVGLFILLSLLAFTRAGEAVRPRAWLMASALSALLAIATKEVAAGLPLLVLLCDRAFYAGGFVAAWRERRPYYLALFATWVPLAVQIAVADGRGGTVGFGLAGVSSWEYLLTQGEAITRYLGLAFWPTQLVFDYGTGVADSLAQVWPHCLLVLTLLAGAVVALVKTPRLGFLLAWFFLILAPSSSFVPIVTETMAEHRMYLPLATLSAMAGMGLAKIHRPSAWFVAALIACALGTLTWNRNREYASEETLWATSVARYPRSARAHNNYGESLARRGADAAAIHHYSEAVRLHPGYLDALCNLGGVLHRSGQREKGLELLSRLVADRPDYAPALSTYGASLYREGKTEEAVRALERALELKPGFPDALNNLGVIMNDTGRPLEALGLFQRALIQNPVYADALYNAAHAYARLGRLDEAAEHYLRCLQVQPGRAEAINNLGVIALSRGRNTEALAHFERAMAVAPDYPDAMNNAGVVLYNAGEVERARRLFERALELRPDYVDARRNLRELGAPNHR